MQLAVFNFFIVLEKMNKNIFNVSDIRMPIITSTHLIKKIIVKYESKLVEE